MVLQLVHCGEGSPRAVTRQLRGWTVLRAEINELLTRTGPGTPMGDLFRQYWVPAMLAEELPENDCPPVRVKLLSERMVAFRDSEGRYGLIDEFGAHRGASLWFGRNEGSGLRCPYHGWKYDITGQAIEVPSEPENSNFCAHVKLTSYPLVKIGDVLWTYMGDPEKQPPPPEFEFAVVPPEQTYTSKRWQECNWLQAFEGLQPVAFLPAFGGVRLLWRNDGELELRGRRLLLRITHVCPEHVADLDQRVGRQLDMGAEVAVLGFRRHLDGLAGDVILPAVIRATQP